jgi:hypothetical protein
MNRTRIAAALTLCLLLVSGRHLAADVKADEKGIVKFEGTLGRVVNLFGGKAAREGVKSTVAVKGDRKATLTDAGGQIIDLNEEKIYDLDLRRKTYKVTTFAELRRRMEEAQRKAEEDARKEQAREKPSEPSRDPNQKELEVDFNVKETGEKKAINGFDTRQFIMTIALREKGKTLEAGGGMVLTADTWLAPTIAAMKELVQFDVRYAQKLQGPMVAGASAEEMAAALAMYPGLKDALGRMRSEGAKMDGTPIVTTLTVEAVKSAEQVAAEQKQGEESRSPNSGTVGGLLGGLARRAARKDEAAAGPKARVTFMTTTNDVLSVATTVATEDVAVPAGFKENK